MLIFDLTPVQYSHGTKFHGGGEYAKIILNELIKSNKKFSCVYTTELDISNDCISSLEHNDIAYLDYKEIGLIKAIRQLKGTTFYSALPYRYGKLDFSGIRFIGTIHGLRTLEILSDKYMHIYENSCSGYLKSRIRQTKLYEYIGYKKSYKELLTLFHNKDFRFIVVSNHTKYSITSIFPDVPSKEIKVLYSPSLIDKRTKFETRENYYLMVSGNRWLKNNYRAILAVDDLLSKGLINHNVIITGNPSKRLLNRIKNKDAFSFMPYVSTEELSDLMQKAFCFIYPSLNEGFGYPPLQAMAYGTPTIASSCCSIPEICGNGVFYFNPFSIGEIENRLMQIEDSSFRHSLVNLGYARFEEVTKKQKEDLKTLIEYIFND